MNPRLTTLAMLVGGAIGGYVPSLWGAGALSFSGLFFSSLGAAAGVWLAFRSSRQPSSPHAPGAPARGTRRR